jgi:hypothetical protein
MPCLERRNEAIPAALALKIVCIDRYVIFPGHVHLCSANDIHPNQYNGRLSIVSIPKKQTGRAPVERPGPSRIWTGEFIRSLISVQVVFALQAIIQCPLRGPALFTLKPPQPPHKQSYRQLIN